MYIYENLIRIFNSFLERNVKLQYLSLVEKLYSVPNGHLRYVWRISPMELGYTGVERLIKILNNSDL